MSGKPSHSASSRVRTAVRGILLIVLALAIVEGTASLLMVFAMLPADLRPRFAERLHTRYDADLGWVNEPGVVRPDLYGPGATLTINEQGFRSQSAYEETVPPGRRRVICSGDSFTLGYGVDDSETWCALLERHAPALETVNMGQGGYGIGQAWLWYRRDGSALDHDLHLFAFVSEDFARMMSEEFFGYGKPRLRIGEDGIHVDNVPTPRPDSVAAGLARGLGGLRRLRSVELARALAGQAGEQQLALDLNEMSELTWAVFSELQRQNSERSSHLALVFLPMQGDRTPGPMDEWRAHLRDGARTHGLLYIDLVEPFRALPDERLADFFIPNGALAYPAAAGHYTAQGNDWVATELLRALRLRLPGFDVAASPDETSPANRTFAE